MTVEVATRLYLLYLVLPLWLLAGLSDYLCHRASDIAHTSGWRESVIHAVMLAEAGAAVLLGLFFEINALVIACMILAFVLHEATSLYDLSYAWKHREVTPVEQHVHNYLVLIPFMAMSFAIVLHWPQALAIFGFGPAPADWSLRLKSDPLPGGYLAAILSAILVFEILPYAEELLRTVRAARRAARP